MNSFEKNGTVYWFTGLAGSGKTSIGKSFYLKLKEEKKGNCIFIDGDQVRDALGNRFGYKNEERKYLAKCYGRFCKLFSEQGLDVICCTISMYEEIRKINRLNICNYKEIYIKVPNETLIERDQKGLYSNKKVLANKELVGVESKFEEPLNAEITIENDGKLKVSEILDKYYDKITKATNE